MKRIITIGIIVAGILIMPTRSKAQGAELQQLILNIEKLLQFRHILDDMKKGYDIVSKGYGTIKDLSEGNFSLHKTFLDGLMAVSPTVRNYRKVAEIIDRQVRLVREYKAAWNRFRRDGNFTVSELDYLARVYANLFDQSLKDLDNLVVVITANKLRMSDDERLKAIDALYEKMADKLAFLREFNNSTTVLAVQRAREKKDVGTLSGIYGVTP